VAAVDGAEQDPRNPFSAADTLKLFTTVCGRAWDGGYASQEARSTTPRCGGSRAARCAR